MLALAVVGARLAQFAGAMILFGSPLFYLYGLPASGVGAALSATWPRRTLLAAALLTAIGAVVALMVQTANLTGEPQAAFQPDSLWLVIAETQYGLAVAVRLALIAIGILALFVLSRSRPKPFWTVQAAIGGAVVASFAWTGHGAATEGPGGLLHLGADILHLLAAAVWLGALLPLAVVIVRSCKVVPPDETLSVHRGLESFSGIGTAVVAVLVLTGLVNSWFLVGVPGLGALWRTDYGLLLVAKLVFFGLMLCLAAANRFLLTPKLGRALGPASDVTPAIQALRTSIIVETSLAALVLIAVAILGTLAPISAR